MLIILNLDIPGWEVIGRASPVGKFPNSVRPICSRLNPAMQLALYINYHCVQPIQPSRTPTSLQHQEDQWGSGFWKCLRLGVIGCHLPFDHFHFGTAFVALADSLSFKTCGWLVAWENELMLAGDACWRYLLVMLTGSTVRNALSTEIAIGRYISFPWATGHL